MGKSQDQERFDALIGLAEFRRAVRDSRIQREWHVSYGLWALLAAAAVGLRDTPFLLLAITMVAVVLLHAWFWVRVHWLANELDGRRMHFLADSAERMVLPDGPAPDRRPMSAWRERLGFLGHQQACFQILATAALAGAVLVTASDHSAPDAFKRLRLIQAAPVEVPTIRAVPAAPAAP